MSLIHQNWWLTTLLVRQHKFCPPLSKSLKCDVLIAGLRKGPVKFFPETSEADARAWLAQ